LENLILGSSIILFVKNQVFKFSTFWKCENLEFWIFLVFEIFGICFSEIFIVKIWRIKEKFRRNIEVWSRRGVSSRNLGKYEVLFGSKPPTSSTLAYICRKIYPPPLQLTLHPYKPPYTPILSFLPFYFFTVFSPFSEHIEFTSQQMFPNVIFHFDKFTGTFFKMVWFFSMKNEIFNANQNTFLWVFQCTIYFEKVVLIVPVYTYFSEDLTMYSGVL
jgi:hypothetical protein